MSGLRFVPAERTRAATRSPCATMASITTDRSGNCPGAIPSTPASSVGPRPSRAPAPRTVREHARRSAPRPAPRRGGTAGRSTSPRPTDESSQRWRRSSLHRSTAVTRSRRAKVRTPALAGARPVPRIDALEVLHSAAWRASHLRCPPDRSGAMGAFGNRARSCSSSSTGTLTQLASEVSGFPHPAPRRCRATEPLWPSCALEPAGWVLGFTGLPAQASHRRAR